MEESILTSIKKLIGGMEEDCNVFDTDLIIHINSVFTILRRLGVGPAEGFRIEGSDAAWSDFINDDIDLEAVKTYVYLKVKLIFDPPLNSTIIKTMEETIKELEWSLNVSSENSRNSVE